MSDLSKLAGVIPALITPLKSDRVNVDEEGLRRLIKFVLDAGVHGVFAMGSSGEFFAFSRDERRRIVEFIVDEVAGRVPVFAGISDSSSDLAVANAREAEKAGADAAVLVLPYYISPPTQQEMMDHFRYVKEHTTLPLAMYNVPQAVKGMINADTICQLAHERTIFALKDSSCNFNHFQQVVLGTEGLDFPIFQGSEPQLAASVLMGGDGGVLGLGNVCPRLCVEIHNAAAAGDVQKARDLQARMTKLWDLFWIGESSMGGMKAAVALLGICEPTTTRPITTVSEASMAKIKRLMEETGVLPV